MISKTPLEQWIVERTGIKEPDREALSRYQLERIKETIRYAREKSPFYARHLKGTEVEAIGSLKDLKNLPFTEPFQLSAYARDFLCVSPKKVSRIVTIPTSGTTGQEKRIFFTDKDLERTIDFFQYGMSCLSDQNDRVLVLLPGAADGSIGDLLKKALMRSKTECIVYGIMDDTNKVAEMIRSSNISCLVGIPSQILNLSRVENGIFQQYIHKILLSTDYVPDALVRELDQKYDCRVFNHYGMTEMGYGGGVECGARNGYHLREGDLYVEITDPCTGRSLPDGEYGEVVFTTFGREAMPLIRYRTGDIARFAKEPCECGTFLRTLEKVKGRRCNSLQLSEGRLISLTELDEFVLACENVLKYQPYLEDGPRLVLEIAWMDSSQSVSSKAFLQEQLQKYLGEECRIQFVEKAIQEWPQLVNSMVKRTFLDRRRQ